MNLPSPIQAYFDANAQLDARAMLAPFAADAIVHDEGGIHRGTDAIQAWIEAASLALPAVATPQSARAEGDTHHVEAKVSGSFPGSPLTLSFRFRLADERISALEIQ